MRPDCTLFVGSGAPRLTSQEINQHIAVADELRRVIFDDLHYRTSVQLEVAKKLRVVPMMREKVKHNSRHPVPLRGFVPLSLRAPLLSKSRGVADEAEMMALKVEVRGERVVGTADGTDVRAIAPDLKIGEVAVDGILVPRPVAFLGVGIVHLVVAVEVNLSPRNNT